MTDDFASGWIEFEMFVRRLMDEKHLTTDDIEQYVKMLKEDSKP